MTTYNVNVNGQAYTVDVGEDEEDIGILYYLRDELHISGPKYGCGVNVCKACTCRVKVPRNGNGGPLVWKSMTTCTTTFRDLADQLPGNSPNKVIEIITIEGLAGDNGALHPVQQAWVDHDVAQCGFCQPGQIMRAIQVIEDSGGNPSDDDIDGIANVCRCGTYARIREAIKDAADAM